MDIKKAWGVYWKDVSHDVDKHGWYNGGQDLRQKSFDGLDVVKVGHKVRPKSLGLSHQTNEDNSMEDVEQPQPTIQSEDNSTSQNKKVKNHKDKSEDSIFEQDIIN